MLAGKCALVTGSTSGIGAGIAAALAAEGAAVILNGFGEATAIEAQRAGLAETHDVAVSYFDADMSKPDDIAAMMERAEAQSGGVDILINNAGIQHLSRVVDMPPEQWDAIIAVNLTALFHTTRAALPGMERKGWGRIVNISSAHGHVAAPEKAPYVAAKHGVIGLTKTVALEVARAGITCNAICPGFVWTPLVQNWMRDKARERGQSLDETAAEMVAASQPTGEFVTPEQIGGLAVFLCSDSAAQINGASLSMDGGYTAQ